MNIDLGSPVLDIAIGVSFIFFLLSVIASAVSETFAGITNLRGETLKKGLEGMLGDAALVTKLFQHPLIRTQVDKTPAVGAVPGEAVNAEAKTERTPSYISPRDFAHAFRAVAADSPPERVASQLTALGIDTGNIANANLETLEKWFDDAMDRVSGWYRRKSQIITVIVAAVIAFGLNANAFRIVERLDKEPTVRSAVVAQAEASAKGGEFKNETEPSGKGSIESAGNDAASAYDQIDSLKLPILWAGENVPQTFWPIVMAVIGCLLTTIAISLGAPFWFDTLGKLSNLRLAGKKPEPEASTAN